MRRITILLAALALWAISCSSSNGDAKTVTSTVTLPTVAPSTEAECAAKIRGYAAEVPDLAPIDDLDPSDQETVDRALDASVGWTGEIAETYECVATYGPQLDGDAVLAERAAVLYLVDLVLNDFGIRAVIRSAMVGIDRFYPESCFAAAAGLWLESEEMDLEQMGTCP